MYQTQVTVSVSPSTLIVFAGSAERIPGGVNVAGVDVGGLTASEARAKLAALAARRASDPVTFTASGHRFSVRPSRLDVRADWTAAAASAVDKGDGPIPLRGLERLRVRLFGAEIAPAVVAYARDTLEKHSGWEDQGLLLNAPRPDVARDRENTLR